MEKVLCQKVGDPPANVNTVVQEDQIVGQLKSTRTRYHDLTEKAGSLCISCHSRINSYGYVLEGFDTMGRWRTQETVFNKSNGSVMGVVPVDFSANIQVSSYGETRAIASMPELGDQLAKSDLVRICLAKGIRRFDVKSNFSESDNCVMNEILDVIDYQKGSGEGSFMSAIKAYVNSNEFKKWRY